MLNRHKLVLPIRHSASLVHHSLHHALISTTTSSDHFAAEDYLVSTCGLTKEQAAKAAKYIAHCKSPTNANAVLSFLVDPALGFSKADIAHLVSQDARILNCNIEKTLRPRIDAFFSHGFTTAQIRTFLRLCPTTFRCFNIDQKLGFWVTFMGSREKFLHLMKRNFYLVTSDLEGVIKVNIQMLREYGLSDGDILKLCVPNARLPTCKTDTVRAILLRAEEIGVPRDSAMFRQAVACVSSISQEAWAPKLKFIGELLGCSDAKVATAVKMCPALMRCSREKLHRVSEFLTKVVGLDGKYILRRPAILMYSLERRIAPRYYVMKVLVEKGLLKVKSFSLVVATDKSFESRYIIPYKDALPGLADTYASACKGKLPI